MSSAVRGNIELTYRSVQFLTTILLPYHLTIFGGMVDRDMARRDGGRETEQQYRGDMNKDHTALTR